MRNWERRLAVDLSRVTPSRLSGWCLESQSNVLVTEVHASHVRGEIPFHFAECTMIKIVSLLLHLFVGESVDSGKMGEMKCEK